MSRMLVTGAAGFIGRHLAKRLVDLGHEVVATDRRAAGADAERSRLRFVVADVRDQARLAPLLADVDTVFHLASVHLDVRADATLFHEVNVDAAMRLAEACARAGVRRLVHASSVGVYGHVQHPPASERSALHPISAYERSKLAGEQAVTGRSTELGLDLVVVRPAWVYGPGCPRTEKLLDALERRRFFYVGPGSNLRHPVWIADAVEGFVQAAVRAPDGQRVYILAGPRALPLRELVNAASAALGVDPPTRTMPMAAGRLAGRLAELAFAPLGKDPPFSRRSLAFFENDNAFDIGRAREELGFQPTIDVEEGFRMTVAARRSRELAA